MNKGNIHIGTSGWHYKDWRDLYYPKQMKAANWLSFYSGEFKATEINNSFYRLPSIDTVKNWTDTVPDDFRFCPKFSRYFTQMKSLKDPGEPFKRFFTSFEPMREKLGPVLLQLPPRLRYQEERIRAVFELIRKDYNEYSFAVEVRHPDWMNEEYFGLLREYDVAFTISQQSVGWPYEEQITSKNIYLRFHGPKQLFASRYDEATMKAYAARIRKWAVAGHDVWVFFNNDWFGYAIKNARQLKRMLHLQ